MVSLQQIPWLFLLHIHFARLNLAAESTSEQYVSSSTAAPASLGDRKKSAPAVPPIVTQQPPSAEASSDEEDDDEDDEDENDNVGTNVELGAQNAANNQRSRSQSIQMANKGKFGSKGALHSPVGSAHSFDLQVSVDGVV